MKEEFKADLDGKDIEDLVSHKPLNPIKEKSVSKFKYEGKTLEEIMDAYNRDDDAKNDPEYHSLYNIIDIFLHIDVKSDKTVS